MLFRSHELPEGTLCGTGASDGGGIGTCAGSMRGGAADGLPEYGKKRNGGGEAAGSGVKCGGLKCTALIVPCSG